MIPRILIVMACSLVVGAPSLHAQQAALRPHPSPLFVASAAVADPGPRPATYWKTGAVVGGTIGGVLGAVAFNGLCHMDDANASNCGVAALAGAAVGFLIGAVPGALIGGQIHQKE